MVDRIPEGVDRANIPVGPEGADGAAQPVGKQTPAGALALTRSGLPQPVAPTLLSTLEEAARAQGAPISLRAPNPDAASPSRLGQVATTIGSGGDGGQSIEFDMTKILLLMHDVVTAERKSNNDARKAAGEAHIATQQAAVAKMAEAAQDRFIGAIVDNAVQLGTAAFALGAAAFTAKLGHGSDEATHAHGQAKAKFDGDLALGASESRPTYDAVSALKNSADTAAVALRTREGMVDGVQKVALAIGKTSASGAELAADNAAVAQRDLEIDASQHETAARSAQEMAGEYRERMKDVLQTLQSILQSLNAATDAINRNS
jgi:hypothetical protein